jgi:hypothetical protein
MNYGTQNTIKKVVGPCFTLRLDHNLEYNHVHQNGKPGPGSA